MEKGCKNKFVDKKNSNRKWTILICLVVLVFVATMLPACTMTKTVEKGNGFKHQIGEFDKCKYEDCGVQATHRIKARGVKEAYCEKHWESDGEYTFYRLSDERTKEDKEYLVKAYARSVVKKELIAPSTAEFCAFYEMTAVEKYGEVWLIQGYVDAENIFGAKIREYWIVELTLTKTSYENASVVFK